MLLGWRSREAILGDHEPAVVRGGLFRPFALVDGKAVATWKLTDGDVAIAPFERLEPSVTAALEADGADVVRFLAGAAPGHEAASIAPPGRDSSAGRAHD